MWIRFHLLWLAIAETLSPCSSSCGNGNTLRTCNPFSWAWLAVGISVFLLSPQAIAQPALTGSSSWAAAPGKTTRLELVGQNFKAPLRVGVTQPADVQIVAVEPTKASIDITVREGTQLGPMGLWVGTDDGVSDALQMLVDNLPSVLDNGANHARSQSQSLAIPCAVDGKSEASQSDFYTVHLAAGSSLSVDVVAERIGSTMDSVVRVYDASGRLVAQSDDNEVGPDARVRFVAANEGDFVIELVDSRFAGDGRYRMRIGDFPLGNIPYPLAVRPGVETALTFLQSEAPPSLSASNSQSLPIPFTVTAGTASDRVNFGPSLPNTSGGVWAEVLVRDFALHVEPLETTSESVALTPLTLPVGISGRLLKTGEKDHYPIAGTQGQTVRISARTRSLGTPTLLRMQLVNTAGQTIAETAVNESDEWSMDVTFPETGAYQLKVFDLLDRGGPAYAYWVELLPAGRISVAVKPDANTRESRALEANAGATFVDLLVQRFGYDGAVQLELVAAPSGIRILNPTIPAKGVEHRVYFATDAQWNPTTIQSLQWIAKPTEIPAPAVAVNNLGLRRAKLPSQPYPPSWLEGSLTLSGMPTKSAFFSLEHPASIPLATPLQQHTVSVSIKRLVPEFKEPVSVLSAAAPEGWTAQPALDKDTLKFTLVRIPNAPTSSAPAAIGVSLYGQMTSGRIENFTIPVTWYDPLQLTVDQPGNVLAGSLVPLHVRLQRSGENPQPVVLTLSELPAGITVAGPVTVAADQTTATIGMQVAPDFVATSPVSVQVHGASKIADADYKVSSNSVQIAVEAAPTRMEVYPQKISLNRSRDRARAVLTGWDAADHPQDWTERTKWTSSNPAVFQWQNGAVIPTGNGNAELIAELGGAKVVTPVSVENFDQPSRVEFENEVLVALSKQGCNSGACHGSPSGKGSFRLSLRAFDRQLDTLTLVREEAERRLNTISPDESLLLLKPLMKVPHGGGVQIHKSDAAYGLLRDWIAQGAPLDPPDQSRCVKLEVFPNSQRVVMRDRGEQQLVVIAHFANGKTRDVTSLTVFESSNTSVATVSVLGRVTPITRGESVIMARYLEHIESVPFMFVDQIPGFEWKSLPEANYIDTLVDAKLRQLQYVPASVCTDEVFLRRVYLDLLGILPSVEETTAFLTDTSGEKRNRLIDQLLDRPEHAKFWAMKWGDLLRLTGKSVGADGVYKYHRWVEQAIRDNVPYNEFAKQLLSASGSTYSNPPANFYRTAGDMNDCVETISQVFLGARLQCAKCHNHPFERWTQDNYYGLGAFFQRVQRKKTQRPNELLVWSSGSGEVVQPRTGQTMKPWVPVSGELAIDPATDRRLAFVDWLVRPDNPYLARVEANRIWSQLFARGIVDPIDDFRDSNPPTNRPLLDALTKAFVDSGFDRKALIRTILQSRTYQSTFETNPFNEKDTLYFSHQQPRLLGAEQLLDAINQLTQVDQNFGTLPPGTKATQIPAPDIAKVDFLKVFGQPERSTVCACERSEDSNLSMAIELFNGSTIYEKLRNPNNRFRKGVAAGKPVDEIVCEMYLAGLCRNPTPEELAEAVKHCQSKPDPIAGLEDLCWVLINTDEFLFQH